MDDPKAKSEGFDFVDDEEDAVDAIEVEPQTQEENIATQSFLTYFRCTLSVISLANMPLTCWFMAQGILSNTCHKSSNLL